MDSINNLPDDCNPKFMFQTTDTELLVHAVNKKIDLLHLVKQELANRGLNKNGLWVGFEKAKKIYGFRK